MSPCNPPPRASARLVGPSTHRPLRSGYARPPSDSPTGLLAPRRDIPCSDSDPVRREAEWDAFYRFWRPALRKVVGRVLSRLGRRRPVLLGVEDMVQEVFCRFLEDDGRRLRTFRGEQEGELHAWITRVARRTAVDLVRSQHAGKRGGKRSAASFRILGNTEKEDFPAPSRLMEPEETVLSRERLAQWRHSCLEATGSRRRAQIVDLAVVGGWTSRELSRRYPEFQPSGIDSLVWRTKRRMSSANVSSSGWSRRRQSYDRAP